MNGSGEVFVAGYVDPTPGPGGSLPADDVDVLVLRFSSASAQNLAFGTSGIFTCDGGLGEEPNALAARAGALFVGSTTNSGGGNVNTLVLKLDESGALQSSFSGDGIATYDSGNGTDRIFAIDVDSDGEVYATGVTPNASNATEGLLILKYDADGTPDAEFDDDDDKCGLLGAEAIGILALVALSRAARRLRRAGGRS